MKKAMNSIQKMIATMIAVMVIINLVPAQAFAASTKPYCRIAYSASASAMTNTYYSYKKGVAQVDFSRCLKWYDGKLYLTKSNTLVTDKLKSDSQPAWTTDGSYLVWFESDSSVWSRKYGASSNIKLAEKAKELGINAEHMVTTVTMSDNSSKKISDLVKSTNSGGNSSGGVSEASGESEGKTNTSSGTNINTSGSTNTYPSTGTTSNKITVSETVNSAGETVVTFGSHKIKVDGKDIYLDSYKISELCNSGVRYVGVDSSSRVYLYEDDSNSFYRFSVTNIFAPDKIKFASGCTLDAVNIDKKTGVLTGIITSNGEFTVSQLVADEVWYPSVSYAINKSGYSTYYLAETSKTYTLTLKSSKLYLGSKQVATGITRKTQSFGFAGSYILYLKGSKVYTASIANPTSATLLYQNVAKLNYSSKDGTVSSVKRLSSKTDWVKESANRKSAILYQSGKKSKELKVVKSGTQVTLNGKVIAKVTNKQKKAGIIFKAVGFTENGYIFYSTNKQAFKAPLSSPKKATKWSLKTYKFSSLGFVSKAS